MLEYLWAQLLVERKNLGRGVAEAESDGDDPARGCSCDEIELINDARICRLLKGSKKRSGEHTFDAAAVDGKNLFQIGSSSLQA